MCVALQPSRRHFLRGTCLHGFCFPHYLLPGTVLSLPRNRFPFLQAHTATRRQNDFSTFANDFAKDEFSISWRGLKPLEVRFNVRIKCIATWRRITQPDQHFFSFVETARCWHSKFAWITLSLSAIISLAILKLHARCFQGRPTWHQTHLWCTQKSQHG